MTHLQYRAGFIHVPLDQFHKALRRTLFSLMSFFYPIEILNDFLTRVLHFYFAQGPAN